MGKHNNNDNHRHNKNPNSYIFSMYYSLVQHHPTTNVRCSFQYSIWLCLIIILLFNDLCDRKSHVDAGSSLGRYIAENQVQTTISTIINNNSITSSPTAMIISNANNLEWSLRKTATSQTSTIATTTTTIKPIKPIKTYNYNNFTLIHNDLKQKKSLQPNILNDVVYKKFSNSSSILLHQRKRKRRKSQRKFTLKSENSLSSFDVDNNVNNYNGDNSEDNNDDDDNHNDNNNNNNNKLMLAESTFAQTSFQGFVEPPTHFHLQQTSSYYVPPPEPQTPTPLSSQVTSVTPGAAIVAEISPIRTNPVLLDFMHLDTPITLYHHHTHHHASPQHPQREQQHLHVNPHSRHVTAAAAVAYPNYDIQPFSNVYYDHNGYPLHSHPHHQHHPMANGLLLGDDSSSEYTLESVKPVAQNMLFAEQNNYYTPYKVNSINVYSRYLLSDDNDDSDDDDGENDDEEMMMMVMKQKKTKNPKCYQKKPLTNKDVEEALKSAVAKVKWYAKTITDNAIETKRRQPYVPSGVLDSKIFEYTSQYLKNRNCLNKMDVITILPKINARKISLRYEMNACYQEERIICEPKAKFRSIDGSCNNLKMKTWGKSFTCHRRLLPSDYADGVSLPRQANDGGKLPNARDISSLLLPDIDVQDHKLTSMTMAFGQFIIHDIARTLPTANDIQCCPSKDAVHPECFAIDIKRSDDVLWRYFNQTCINFVRSIVCNPCAFGPREQQNQATHTFDLSHIYGLRLNDSLALRTFRGGKLRVSLTSTYPKEELPPKMTREDPGCNVRPIPPRFKCFETADGIRASQHPALQSLHTAFHRRHNQHAEALAKINPHWNDEKLYQETRHIMIAEVSTMIYGQYLSAIFGKKLMKHFRLGLKKHGYTKYDPKLNPSTFQEFIVAAGRFGHSQINDQFRVLFNDHKMSYSYSLRDNFFETTIVSLGHSGGILKGLATDSTQATDPYFVDDVKNSLYHLRRERFGRDLPAFNIQRGREHGIPGYVFYLDFCFGFKVQKWNDLVTFIPKKYLKKIRLFYKHWKDIDLFVGGVFERLISGAAFGPTFGCINGIQFYNFKYGDRFYFEHGYQSGSFTPAQLNNIKKVSSLSSLICKTHTEVKQMPMNPFLKASPHNNPLIPCFQFPEIDYNLWIDKKKTYSMVSKKKPQLYGSPKGGYSKKYHYQYAASDHFKNHHSPHHYHQQFQNFIERPNINGQHQNYYQFDDAEDSGWSVDHSEQPKEHNLL